jgi:hypothetical protein
MKKLKIKRLQQGGVAKTNTGDSNYNIEPRIDSTYVDHPFKFWPVQQEQKVDSSGYDVTRLWRAPKDGINYDSPNYYLSSDTRKRKPSIKKITEKVKPTVKQDTLYYDGQREISKDFFEFLKKKEIDTHFYVDDELQRKLPGEHKKFWYPSGYSNTWKDPEGTSDFRFDGSPGADRIRKDAVLYSHYPIYKGDPTPKHNIGGKVNRTGYLKNAKTKDNDYNIIPSGNITTKGMAFPIFANGKLLYPDTGDFKFNTKSVLEVPAFNKGGLMKKLKLKAKPKKMQTGGILGNATPGFNNPQNTTATLGALGEGVSLLAPHQKFTETNAPNLGIGDALAGAKAGASFGPWGAAIGAGLGLTKDVVDFNQDLKDWRNNLNVARGENKVTYDRTHKPYGSRGYMQGTPNESVYSLQEGGMPGSMKKAFWNSIANAQTSHGSVSLSKQEGGEIPNDLNELFDRAMEESGGDEQKAEQLVQQYQEHPEMMQNKPQKKHPHLKKKK